MNGILVDRLRLKRRLKSPQTWALGSRPGMRFVETDHAKIRVRIEGRGSPTIAINCDPPNVIEHYDEIFERLTPKHRVVCFEAPGFGFSFPKKGFDFSFEHDYQLTVALLHELAMAPYLLAFPCLGGFIGLRAAAEHPHLVQGLALSQLPGWGEEAAWLKARDVTGILRCPVLGQCFTAWFPKWSVRHWYDGGLGKDADFSSFAAITQRAITHGACYCLASSFQGFFKGKEPDFGGVSQPVMVIWGNSDFSHAETDKRSILRYVPRASWHDFDRAGHSPDLEEPGRFCDLIEKLAGTEPEPCHPINQHDEGI